MNNTLNKSLSLRTNILFIASVFLSSCSLFDDTFLGSPSEQSETASQSEQADPGKIPSAPDSPTTKVGVEDFEVSKDRTISDIEVIWQIPEETVDGYLITYGYEPENLDQQVKLQAQSIEKFEDKHHGFVFRHVLSGIPLSKTVYISISAYNGNVVSGPSKTFKVTSQ